MENITADFILLCTLFCLVASFFTNSSCFVLSALQYILHTVLKLLINVAFLFSLKTPLLTRKKSYSFVTTFLLVDSLDIIHPPYRSELELIGKTNSWLFGAVGNTKWPFIVLNIKRIKDFVLEGFFSYVIVCLEKLVK